MSAQTGWFIGGIILVALLAMYAPRFAGVLVILLVTYLALTSARKGLV